MAMRTNALWFFVALFGGGVAIWWTKSTIPNAWFAAGVAAGVIFALMTYYLLNDENSPEEEGDNVYYLGLLFTLLSLMFTLVELFGTHTNLVHNTEKIRALLENFGIALTSTVAGIAGRVALQNWQRAGTAETPDIARYNVDSASPFWGAGVQDMEGINRHLLGRIARDLTQGANALARFHRIVRSHATDSEDYLLNQTEVLKQEATQFKDTLQNNTDTFTQQLKSQAESTLQTVGGTVDTVVQKAEALLQDFQFTSDAYLAGIRVTTQSFNDEVELVTGKNLDALRRNFEAAGEQSLLLAQNLTSVNERIDMALAKLESRIEQASDANAVLGNSAHRAARSASFLESEIEKLRTALTEHAARAAELYETFTRRIETTEAEAQRAAEALQALASEAEARVEALRPRQGSGFGFWSRR